MNSYFKKLFLASTSYLFLLYALCPAQTGKNTADGSETNYGQAPPGIKPKLFAKKIVEETLSEGGCVFSNDASEIYYFIFKRNGRFVIMHSKIENGAWRPPAPVSFSGRYSDVHPFFSADNSRLYFGSSRPVKENQPVPYFNLWYVERNGVQWSDPMPLGPPINTGYESCGSIGPDGALYFRRVSKTTRGDIFQSKYIDGKFSGPVKLPDSINSDYDESHPCVSPEGAYMIFSSKRPGGLNNGRDDLWISFKRADGSWTAAVNMGKEINSGHNTSIASISPDGRYLFYSSTKSGRGDIYWVSTKIIEKLNPKTLKKENDL